MHVHEIKRRREDERAAAVKSARPSPHALLALQRSAGNRAVAGVIARVIKPSVIRYDVKQAIAAGKKTKDAVLLHIYNEERLSTSITVAFTKVSTAVDKLVEAGRISAEDAENYAAEAEKQLNPTDTTASSAETLRAEVEEDRAGMKDELFNHVLLGAWAKKTFRPVGYHSTKGGSTTHEAFGAKTGGENGTYQRSVRAVDEPANVKETQSTFFPDTATAEQIKDAITSVYGKHGKALGVTSVRYPATLKGIKLTQRDGTAFPFSTPALTGEGFDSSFKPKKR